MATIVQVSRPASSNRRGRVRQKVHVPAYATVGHSPGELQDLHEVLDMSECGVALQCSRPRNHQSVELSLDLAEAMTNLYHGARGMARLGRSRRSLVSSSRIPPFAALREWLFLNALAATANAESGLRVR